MLTPETIVTERVSGTDPDELVPLLGPDFGHVSVTFTPFHASPHYRPSHDEASINQKRQACIRTWGRNQMHASKAEQQPLQYLEVGLSLSGLAKATVQNTLLFSRHDEISTPAKAARRILQG